MMISDPDHRNSSELPEEARSAYLALMQRMQATGAEGYEATSSQSKNVAPTTASDDNGDMSEFVPRPELDAKLKAIETKMDGQFLLLNERLTGIDLKLIEQKSTAWKAAGVTIVAILAALAFGGGMFDSGRDTAALVAESERRLSSTLEDAIVRIETAAKQPTAP